MSQFIVSLLLGYVIGSIPTAFLLVQWKSRTDIRSAGTGNVGAMNTFDVTGSKALGIIVFLIDLLKGLGAVLAGRWLIANESWILGAAAIGAVLGHNYSVWLRFKGGRGLSTGVGVMIVLGWIVIPLWCLVWTLHYLVSKNVHHANITASLITPLVLIVGPAQWLDATLSSSIAVNDFLLFTAIIFFLILLKHIEYIQLLLKAFFK